MTAATADALVIGAGVIGAATAFHLTRLGAGQVTVLDRGTVWLDTGTFQSLVQASEYVRVVEERQGFKIGCIEEAAWLAGFIDDARLGELAEPLLKSGYGAYLLELLRHRRSDTGFGHRSGRWERGGTDS